MSTFYSQCFHFRNCAQKKNNFMRRKLWLLVRRRPCLGRATTCVKSVRQFLRPYKTDGKYQVIYADYRSSRQGRLWGLLVLLTIGLCGAAPKPGQTPVPAKTNDKSLVLSDPLSGLHHHVPPGRVIYNGDQIVFTRGKFGRCAHFLKGGSITYHSSVMPTRQGTLSLWISFDKAPGHFVHERQIFIWHAQAWFRSSIQLFVGGSKDWGENDLFYIISDKMGKRFYITIPLTTWKAHQWHQIAITWKTDTAGKSSMALYLDGTLQKARTKLTIRFAAKAIQSPSPKSNKWLYLNPSGTKADYKLEQFKIYNVAREYSPAPRK